MVQVLGYYPPHVGGVEFCASNVSRELARRGVDVTVLTSDIGPAGMTNPGIATGSGDVPTVHRLRALEFAHTPFIPSLPWRLWRASRGAVIHLHVSHVWSDVVAAVVASLGRRPLVAHFHMDTPASGRFGFVFVWYKRWVLGRLLRRAGAVVALSDEQAELVSTRYGVDPAKVRVIPNGVAEEFFAAGPPTQVSPKRPLRLLFVGRIAAQKDLPLLIATVATLDGEATLDIVGDGELRRDVTRLVEALPAGRARLWGALSGEALLARYREADVFVMTSVREGMPLALLEAMAAGLPVVASDVQGLREFVGGVGILVAERTPEAFASAILGLAQDPEKLRALSQASRDAVKSRRWNALTDDVLAAYAVAGGGAWTGNAAPHGLE